MIYQELDTVIHGQLVELPGAADGVLALGTYPAKFIPSYQAPKQAHSSDPFQAYDLYLPDGSKRTFSVTGLGSPVSNP